MSTGLTFGTIYALFGLNAGIIDSTQFSLLVTVVVLSAVVPTATAERWFLPDPERERHEERRHAPVPAEECNISWRTRGPNVEWTIGSTPRSGSNLGRKSTCK